MDDPDHFKSTQDQIQSALVCSIRTAGQISSEDLIFHRSLNPAVGTALDEQSTRLLALSSALLKSAASLTEIAAPSLEDLDDVDNHWRGVVDVLDSLLEKADTSLDEYTGVIKRKTPPTNEQSTAKLKKFQILGNSFKTQNLVKPQLAFQRKPDNADTTPWKPLLTSKPHSVIPLSESLPMFTDEEGHQQYRHPYETEILESHYPDTTYCIAGPIPYLPVDSTKATFIDTFEGVLAMLNELKAAKEIAVDLEHHDARSYIGLVSLMQISTREHDWIVDTLKPWREDLQVLNEVFADPKIIKVFHGAYMDIVWLQRDLGLYITGLFDTHHASRVLGYPGGSLAYLLKRFIDFDADKKYQMADWRIRPLPDEMFFYARADTHFLLYIYDHLRNELVAKSDHESPDENRIEIVLQKSKETSLQRYERQVYDEITGHGPGGWFLLLAKTPNLLSNEQFAIFRAVHAWRDQVARKDDDSTNYVMPNHVMFTIAKLMPKDLVSLYSADHRISHSVKSRASELLAIINSARATGKSGPSMLEVLRPDSIGVIKKGNNLSTKLAGVQLIPEESIPKASFQIGQESLRTEKSMFWGSAFGSSIWDLSPPSSRVVTDMKLSIPLPKVVSESFQESTVGSNDLSNLEDSYGKGHSVPNTSINQGEANVEEEPFVMKTGKKRKNRDIEAKPKDAQKPLGEYDISVDDENADLAREKAARKAQSRIQKKAEKGARKLSDEEDITATAVENEDEEAFDYSIAESVLHGGGKGAVVNGGKQGKPFDPYTKSSDAPKGLRKVHTERAGKSFTFKS